MTPSNPPLAQDPARDPSAIRSFPSQRPPSGNPLPHFFKNMKIGPKLTLAFGILVLLTLAVAAVSYAGSVPATTTIRRTDELRVPTALTSARAQAGLLRMLSSARGYLALGDPEFRTDYKQEEEAFRADLAELERLSPNFNPADQARLEELKTSFAEWTKLPDQLFDLRDDQFEREPAYQLLTTAGSQSGGSVLIGIQGLIETQAQATPSTESIALLKDMANFQGSFAAMLSGLRGYVTTRNRIFRQEYEVNLTLNNNHWQTILSKRERLTESQQATLDEIAENRAKFLRLPGQMFDILESDQWRQDLYLFKTEAIAQSDQMQALLAQMTAGQQVLLQTELNNGKEGLQRANQQTLFGGVVALIFGAAMAYLFHQNIAGPVRQLTRVAEQIRAGQLEAQARVESRDEIGVLAETFNRMTGQLRRTLHQVRQEKRRADDLLHVVIPIGVELSAEKDFNRLLENILLEAKTFCRADAGILYLKEGDRLKFVIVRNDTLNLAMGGTAGQDVTFSRLPTLLPIYDDETTPEVDRRSIAAYAAAEGTTFNISDAYQEEALNLYGPGVFDEKTNYHSISYLTIPLKNSHNQVLGVLQLINAQDPETRQVIPFDPNLQQMMESFSSLAVAALEAYIREQGLKQQIQQLRIEIDEVKRQKQVSEIVDTDFFQDLQSKATVYRRRARRSEQMESDDKTPEV